MGYYNQFIICNYYQLLFAANNFANAQELERPDLAGLERRQRPSSNDKVGASKRYSDMKEIAEHIFNGGGSKFDEKQYWTYGCHCLFLGSYQILKR